MGSQFPYDQELDAGSVPALGEFTRQMRVNLRRWLVYLKSDPPLHDLESKAAHIMDDLTSASGMPGAEKEAIELAVAVSLRFERLGLWRDWYKRLMDLYAPAVERVPKDIQAKFYLCLIRYYLHRTDPVNADRVINSLLDLAAIKSDATLQEAHLAAATVAMTLGNWSEGVALLDDLLQLAHETGDKALPGKAYAVLTHFYIHRLDYAHAFEMAQMVYSVGIALHDHLLILDGLQHMAAAFQNPAQPKRALEYLRLASQYSFWLGYPQQVDYTWQTWGACHYYLGNYVEAEYFMRGAVHAFRGSGHNYAVALLGHGLALMHLKRYSEAEQSYQAALDEWQALKRPADALYARHALAELSWLSGRDDEAVGRIQAAIADAEMLGNQVNEQVLDALRADLIKYRNGIDRAEQ